MSKNAESSKNVGYYKLDTLVEAEREDAKYFKENGIDPISELGDKTSVLQAEI